MLLLSLIGLLVLVAVGAVGAYWISSNVSFKKDSKSE
jgi:hypothetical protein